MEIINKNVLIIVPKKELFDSFMTNTICKHGLQMGNKFAFLEFNYYQEFEASRLLEVIKSSPYSNYDQGIVLFPPNIVYDQGIVLFPSNIVYDQGIVLFPSKAKSYQFEPKEMPMLNDFLFSNGVKQMSGVTVGKNGSLVRYIRNMLKNDLSEIPIKCIEN